MPTTVTVKGQVTLPKSARDAAGIHAGDRVTVTARPEGGVLIELVQHNGAGAAYLATLQDMGRRRPFRGFTTEEVMEISRSEV